MSYIGNKSQQVALYDSYTRDQVDAKIANVDSFNFEFVTVNQNTTLESGTRYVVNFTTGPLTLTLPALPESGSRILIVVGNGDPTNSTIARNGETIMDLSEDLTIDVYATSIELAYVTSDWRII